ncbi:MAG: peptide deformylase [Alphaproteobacteria bacterium]|nr:peptide deformylase [Alphaproteobacteria bacterium]
MAILKVAQLGHPVLRLVARPVTAQEIASEEFQRFCDDLLETMEEYDGTGLAAPQVHASLRVVVLSLDGEREPEFFVNPIITVIGEETSSMMEGCLSVEGMRARVWRPNHIRVHALDRYGKPKAYELEGFPAVVTQHECDHLDGVLYVDRCDTRTLAFMTQYKRFGPVDEWLAEAELEAAEDEEGDDLDVEDASSEEGELATHGGEITEIAPMPGIGPEDDHTEVEVR